METDKIGYIKFEIFYMIAKIQVLLWINGESVDATMDSILQSSRVAFELRRTVARTIGRGFDCCQEHKDAEWRSGNHG